MIPIDDAIRLFHEQFDRYLVIQDHLRFGDVFSFCPLTELEQIFVS